MSIRPPSPRGYNPIRWNCETQGCHTKETHPRVELFAECFPGAIALTDYDMTWFSEVGGRILNLEWKIQVPGDNYFSSGQWKAYEKMAATGYHTVFLVAGNPKSMDICGMRELYGVKLTEWKLFPDGSGLDFVKRRMKDWSAFAEGHKAEFVRQMHKRRIEDHSEWISEYEKVERKLYGKVSGQDAA